MGQILKIQKNISFYDDQPKVHKYPGGVSYQGAWQKKKWHGHGLLTKVDGYTYSGDFCEGVRDGIGVEIYGGHSYNGEWEGG